MANVKTNEKIREMILAGIFMAFIAVFTVVPYTGYIAAGPVEITTLHLFVIFSAVTLNWKYSTLIGGVWGVTCWLRAFTNPLFVMFTNPLISILPRILVGLVAGLVFHALKKTSINGIISAIIAAIAGTLTNTILVISALYIFGGMIASYAQFFEMFKTMFSLTITLNGGIELGAVILLTPPVYHAVKKANNNA